MSRFANPILHLLVLSGVILTGCQPASEQPTEQTQAPAEAKPSATKETLRTQMELLETTSSATQTSFGVAGQVKNVSSRSVSGVVVYYDLQDINGKSIRIEQGPLEKDPLSPNEVSRFRISTTYDPAIKRFSITFAETFGGNLVTRDSRKQ